MTEKPHRYQACRDRHCERPYCRIWREARAEGYHDGQHDGYRDGYAQGFPDGVAACPREHK
jgi:hypothetical protein